MEIIRLINDLKPILGLFIGILLTTLNTRWRDRAINQRRLKSMAHLFLLEIQMNFQSILAAGFIWKCDVTPHDTYRSLKNCDIRTDIYDSFKGELSLLSEDVIIDLYYYYQYINRLVLYKNSFSMPSELQHVYRGKNKNIYDLVKTIIRIGQQLYDKINKDALGGKAEKLSLKYNV